jgi:hypothetical protein
MCERSKKCFTVLMMTIILMIITGGYKTVFADENKKSGIIKGRLLDKYTRRPLAGADVTIPGTTFITITGINGEFAFEGVPVGTYSLKFSYPAMMPQMMSDIIVKSKRITFVSADIQLSPLANESVTVTAGYFDHSPEEPASSIGFSHEEIRRAPGSGGDVNRIIASLPSIAKVSDQANNLVVRGGSPSENLFMVDNIEIPNINHFPFQGSSGGAISILNVDFIRDVNFYAGGFSAIYGDKLSSVMDLTFREGNRENVDGQFSLDMSGAGLVLEGPLFSKRGSWMFSARRSYLDLLIDLLDAGAAVRYHDFQGKLVYDISSKSNITILGLIGVDKSIVTQEDAADLGEPYFGDTRSRESTVGINWFIMWSDKGYSDTSLARTFLKYDNDYWKTTTGTGWLENLSTEETWHLRNVNHYSIGHGHDLRFGFEIKRITSRYDYITAAYTDQLGNQIPGVSQHISMDAGKYAAFAEYSLTPFSRVTFNLGVRADYFDYNRRLLVSPRGSLMFQLSGKTSVGASAGIYRQNLPLLLLYQDKTNRDMNDPLVYQYAVNFIHLMGADTRLTIEAYYKNYHYFPIDPVRPSICLLDTVIGGLHYGDSALVDSGKARSYGIEFVLQKKLKEKIYGTVSGSWFRSQYRDLEGKWRNRLFDNRYIFSLQGGYKANKKWEFSARWIIAGGLPYTPFDMEASHTENTGIFDTERINTQRLPAYHSLNLRVDKRFYFSGSNLTIYISVWNAYNRQNVASYFWNEIENIPDYSYQFSILPVLGVEYEF